MLKDVNAEHISLGIGIVEVHTHGHSDVQLDHKVYRKLKLDDLCDGLFCSENLFAVQFHPVAVQLQHTVVQFLQAELGSINFFSLAAGVLALQSIQFLSQFVHQVLHLRHGVLFALRNNGGVEVDGGVGINIQTSLQIHIADPVENELVFPNKLAVGAQIQFQLLNKGRCDGDDNVAAVLLDFLRDLQLQFQTHAGQRVSGRIRKVLQFLCNLSAFDLNTGLAPAVGICPRR